MKNETRTSGNGVHGMNWLRPEKRLAIYLRDGLACSYCGATLEDGVVLTLDHLTPRCKGGTNEANNLVTACRKCNSSRGDRGLLTFIKATAQYINHGITPQQIFRHVANCRNRKLDVAAAKELIARRGGFTAALRAKEME